mmetsp:Transcript_76835/g.169715  ORF Transcript_76835/g.169715 Transcript_76835/m.169715 type:complete len:265 (+) Transcript_76835:1489-2283(+)
MQLPSNSGAEATTTVRSAWGGHEPGRVTANPNLLDLQRFKRHLCNCLPRCVDDNLEGVRLLAVDGASQRRALSVSDHHGKISPSTDIVLKGMRMKLQQGRRPARLHVAGVTVVCRTIADLTRTCHIPSYLSVVVGKQALISKLELAFIVGTSEELVAVKVNDTVGQLLLLLRESHLDATYVEVCLVFHDNLRKLLHHLIFAAREMLRLRRQRCAAVTLEDSELQAIFWPFAISSHNFQEGRFLRFELLRAFFAIGQRKQAKERA